MPGRIRSVVPGVLAVTLLAASPGLSQVETCRNYSQFTTFGDFRALSRSVVVFPGRDEIDVKAAAFLIDAENGLLLTADHALGTRRSISGMGWDPTRNTTVALEFERLDDPATHGLAGFDMALLRIKGDNVFASALPFHVAGKLLDRVGWAGEELRMFDTVGSQQRVGNMVVSSFTRDDLTIDSYRSENATRCETELCYRLATDEIRPGDSGGPVFDQYGVVHGVVSMKQGRQGHVIPVYNVIADLNALYRAHVQPAGFDAPDLARLMAAFPADLPRPASNLAVLATLGPFAQDRIRDLARQSDEWRRFFTASACILYMRGAKDYADLIKYGGGLDIQVAALHADEPGKDSERVVVASTAAARPYAKLMAELLAGDANLTTLALAKADIPGGLPVNAETTASLTALCALPGTVSADVAAVNRPMNGAEFEACARAGITDIVQARIGYEALGVATGDGGESFLLTAADLYRAMAAALPDENGALTANTAQTWPEVNPALPDGDILAYFPAPDQGGRGVFEETILRQGCVESGAYDLMLAAGMSEERAGAACLQTRQDGRAVEYAAPAWMSAWPETDAPNYQAVIETMQASGKGVGIFGMDVLNANAGKLKMLPLGGTELTPDAVASGTYTAAKPIYLHMRAASLETNPALRAYTDTLVSDDIAGPKGVLSEFGMVSDPDLGATQTKFRDGLGHDGYLLPN